MSVTKNLKRIGTTINLVSKLHPRMGGKLGYRIMCTPYKKKLKPHQLDFLKPARVGGLIANNQKVQLYRWPNNGPKILFLHGWSSHSFRWRPYIDTALAEGFDCMAIDAPGHGLSAGNICNIPLYGDAIAGILQAQKNISYIVAHSMGCISALYAYYVNSNLPMPKKIILLASPGEASDFVEYGRSLLQLNDHSIHHIHQTFIDKFNYPISYYSAPEFVKALRCDGLLIHDRADTDTNYQYSELIHANWSQSELWLTEGKNHQLKDKEVIQKIFTYLAA